MEDKDKKKRDLVDDEIEYCRKMNRKFFIKRDETPEIQHFKKALVTFFRRPIIFFRKVFFHS